MTASLLEQGGHPKDCSKATTAFPPNIDITDRPPLHACEALMRLHAVPLRRSVDTAESTVPGRLPLVRLIRLCFLLAMAFLLELAAGLSGRGKPRRSP